MVRVLSGASGKGEVGYGKYTNLRLGFFQVARVSGVTESV